MINDSGFTKFAEIFPNAMYRRIRPEYRPAPGEEFSKERYSRAKVPIDSTIYRYSDVATSATRVGWIISPGFIVVDIDDAETARRVREWLVDDAIRHCYFTSTRGAHFVFRAPTRKITNSAKRATSLSIEVDYRTEGAGYIILPYNDSSRQWVEIREDMDILPDILFPLKLDAKRVLGLGDGDGRNNMLFEWFNAMKSTTSIPLDTKIKAIKIINKYLFDTPISDDELTNTVLRDENVSNAIARKMGVKKTMAEVEQEVAESIAQDKCLVTDGISIFEYDGTYYKRVPDKVIEREILERYDPSLRSASRREVIERLRLVSPDISEEIDRSWNYVAFANGTLDIRTGTFYEPSPDIKVTTKISRNYVPNAPVSEAIEDFLDRCSSRDVQKRQIILEMIGDCMLRRALFQKMYMIYGEGGTGKSTLLRIITNTIGEENATYLSIRDLENTFYPAELVGKLVNIGDDIPFGKLNDSSQLKKLVSGEKMMVQRKFADPAWFANYATLIFTTNKLPATADRTSGFMRRLVLIDMNTRVMNPSAFYIDSFSDKDYEYLISASVTAIQNAIMRGELTRSFAVDNNVQAYQRMQSSLSEYMDEEEITQTSILDRPVAEVYAEYTFYCSQNGMRPLGKHNFVAELCALLYITTGKTPGNGMLRFVNVGET